MLGVFSKYIAPIELVIGKLTTAFIKGFNLPASNPAPSNAFCTVSAQFEPTAVVPQRVNGLIDKLVGVVDFQLQQHPVVGALFQSGEHLPAHHELPFDGVESLGSSPPRHQGPVIAPPSLHKKQKVEMPAMEVILAFEVISVTFS